MLAGRLSFNFFEELFGDFLELRIGGGSSAINFSFRWSIIPSTAA